MDVERFVTWLRAIAIVAPLVALGASVVALASATDVVAGGLKLTVAAFVLAGVSSGAAFSAFRLTRKIQATLAEGDVPIQVEEGSDPWTWRVLLAAAAFFGGVGYLLAGIGIAVIGSLAGSAVLALTMWAMRDAQRRDRARPR